VSELRVRMDPLNPGQFFACCGLFELIDLDEPGVLAWFHLDSGRPRTAEFIMECSVRLDELLTRLRSKEPELLEARVEGSILPAMIRYGGRQLILDWWLNEFRDKAVNIKCWAGRVTTRILFHELLPLVDGSSSGGDIFERARMTKSKFGVDPRSAWNALDFGFSPDKHKKDAKTFPAVEILASIGLQSFRPARRGNLSYSLWRVPLPAIVTRQVFRSPWAGLPCRTYTFSILPRGSYKYFTFGKESKDQ